MLCFPVRTGAKSVCTNIWRSKVGADGINGGGLSVFSISPCICLIKMTYSSSSSSPAPSLGFGPDSLLQLADLPGLMSFLFKSAQKTLLFALMTLSLYMLLRTSLLGLKSVGCCISSDKTSSSWFSVRKTSVRIRVCYVVSRLRPLSCPFSPGVKKGV